jgi:hypothetical protein
VIGTPSNQPLDDVIDVALAIEGGPLRPSGGKPGLNSQSGKIGGDFLFLFVWKDLDPLHHEVKAAPQSKDEGDLGRMVVQVYLSGHDRACGFPRLHHLASGCSLSNVGTLPLDD